MARKGPVHNATGTSASARSAREAASRQREEQTSRRLAAGKGRRASSWRLIPFLALGLVAALFGLAAVMPEEQTGQSEAPAALAPAPTATAALQAPASTAEAGATAGKIQESFSEAMEKAALGTTASVDTPDDDDIAPPARIPGWEREEGVAPAFTIGPLADPRFADLATLPQTVETVRHNTGGGRDDAISIGAANTGEPMLRLSVYRPGGEATAAGSFYIDVARRAGESAMSVQRLSALPAIATRHGVLEAASIVFGTRTGERQCIAFRKLDAEPQSRLSGWLCGPGTEMVEPATVACLIDSLRWRRAEEPQLASLFGSKGETASSCPRSNAEDVTGSITAATDTAAAKTRKGRRRAE